MRIMIGLIVAAGIAQAVVAQSGLSLRSATIVEINAENVDLSGAGTLDFVADPEKLPPAVNLPAVKDALLLKLWLNGEGRPVQCDPTTETYADLSRAICTQLMGGAHFKLARGFGQPLDRGFIMLEAHFAPMPGYEPDQPIQFVAPGKGRAVQLSIAPASDNAPRSGRCFAMTGEFSFKARTAMCDAYLASEAKNRKPCTIIASNPATGAVMSCSVAVHAPSASARWEIFTNIVPGYRNVDIRYPADATPIAERLAASDGRLEASITGDDYPPVAMREALEGKVAVLLGIGSDGKVVNCRPLRSSGTALLDNTTCSLMVRRAHFLFAGSPPAFSGLRYKTTAMNWALPRG